MGASSFQRITPCSAISLPIRTTYLQSSSSTVTFVLVIPPPNGVIFDGALKHGRPVISSVRSLIVKDKPYVPDNNIQVIFYKRSGTSSILIFRTPEATLMVYYEIRWPQI